MLRLAGALEDPSEHPIARAIATAATERHGALPRVKAFANIEGLGVQGRVAHNDVATEVLVGRARLHVERGISIPAELKAAGADAERQGGTAVVVAWDGSARGLLVVADAIKPTSADAIRQLRRLGLRPMLLTGDNRAVAATVAAEVGIDADSVIAEVLPADKVDVVKRLQNEGRVVAMIGDGSTTPRRSPKPTSAWRWEPAPTSPSRPAT